MNNSNIVDVLIDNIKTDQAILLIAEENIEKAKQEKQDVANRLKDYRKDLSVLLKYVDNKQKKRLDDLGFDFKEQNRELNSIASIAYELIVKSKSNQLTNSELYDGYVNSLENKDTAVSYTEFNIKCRSLFNTQRLLRKKGSNPKSSREDIISLNGKVLEK